MKLFECEPLPNPKRVRMFLAEKGVEIEKIQVDVLGGEHRGDAYRAVNPDATVPCLQLDNGTNISGCVAISEYVEKAHPQNPLMGEAPEDIATISMWQRRVEEGLMDASTNYFHHATEGLGDLEPFQIKEWGEKNAERARATVARLEQELADKAFVAGDTFSIADITAFVGYGLSKYLGIVDGEGKPNVERWYASISQRKSAAA